MADHLVLIGMMGSGKTTVGRLVADLTGRPFVDTDQMVEARAGRSVADLFESEGEPAFRAAETDAVREAVGGADAVISVGGGAVVDLESRRLLGESGLIVWLRAAVGTLTARVGSSQGRPLLGDQPASALERIAQERQGIYAEMADIIIDVDELTPEQAADAVVAGLPGERR